MFFGRLEEPLQRFGVRLFIVAHELHRLHESHSPNVPDDGILLLESFEPISQPFPHHASVLDEIFFFDDLNRRKRRCSRHRIAAKGRDGHPFDAVRHLGRSDGRADGHAIGHAFGKGHNIGLHAPLLYAEHLAAGAAPTRLNFIGDEQPTVLFQNRDNFLEVFFGRRDVAADALNRLRDKRGDTPLRLRLNGLL